MFVKDSKRNGTLDEWNSLNITDKLVYERQATEHCPSHYVEKPLNVRGMALLKASSNYLSDNQAISRWNRLSEEDQKLFIEPPYLDKLYKERLRIWQGYEVVNYLKDHLDKHRFNPYPLLGLYPWEIVKDKIRSTKKLLDFEYDYYDHIIKKMKSRRYLTKAWEFYPGKRSDYDKLENKQPYQGKEQMNKDHNILKLSPVSLVSFHKFYRELFVNEPGRRLLKATNAWNALTEEERMSYRGEFDKRFGAGREYREEMFDFKTEIVMDYIFYTGGVEGCPPDFDWFEYRKSILGNFHYVYKIYTSKIV